MSNIKYTHFTFSETLRFSLLLLFLLVFLFISHFGIDFFATLAFDWCCLSALGYLRKAHIAFVSINNWFDVISIEKERERVEFSLTICFLRSIDIGQVLDFNCTRITRVYNIFTRYSWVAARHQSCSLVAARVKLIIVIIERKNRRN